ncbi:hypothetical protein Nepgr_007629 [Nepenthes gracilis]|uniref:FRIGIDA-like protein n=1 Tax=Nepenthes gracilis TaxID=150966 RepID=A0AAD3XII3_NEPGR|nr:hypothetical protein Nepgr_007629 [Nepenthes gracilis]
MAMLQQISEALQEIDTKKELLRKAFEDLQNHSDTLSFFSLNWSEIDSHFSNIHSSLSSRFSTLQQREQSRLPSSQDPKSSISQELRNQENNATIRELRDMCSKMEAGKLWNWLNERKEKKTVIQVELNEALKFAPDSAKLVMDAIDGFSVTGPEFGDMKIKNRNCMLLLEALMAMEG